MPATYGFADLFHIYFHSRHRDQQEYSKVSNNLQVTGIVDYIKNGRTQDNTGKHFSYHRGLPETLKYFTKDFGRKQHDQENNNKRQLVVNEMKHRKMCLLIWLQK